MKELSSTNEEIKKTIQEFKSALIETEFELKEFYSKKELSDL